jgi:hypothetical protein
MRTALKFITSVLVTVTVLHLCSCNIIPATQCENVADIVRQATLFLCEQGNPATKAARTQQITNQLVAELRHYNENVEAQTLIAKLEAVGK